MNQDVAWWEVWWLQGMGVGDADDADGCLIMVGASAEIVQEMVDYQEKEFGGMSKDEEGEGGDVKEGLRRLEVDAQHLALPYALDIET